MKIKGIHKVKRKLADGSIRVHYYAWRGGPRMASQPRTEAFALEYAKHKANAVPATAETLASLIDRFTGSDDEPNPDWLALAETTRTDHLYAFRLIKAKWPLLPAKLTQQRGMKADIRKWHRSFAANPRKADKLLFSLSKVFSYAIADELLDKNPCAGIGRLYEGSRKDIVWSKAQLSTFRQSAAAHLLLPFEIAINTAQRQGDILAMTWKDYDGTHLQIRQSKGGKRIKVRVHRDLKAVLDALPHDTMRICTNSRGRPWTKDGFKTSWGKECARLKIEGVTFHDLRGTFITERKREGSTAEQIAGVTGHSISEINGVLERHYLADDQQASDAVILRMERNAKRTKRVNGV
ncbi:tyrosine-type recombinase/integrase [Mesorhizobium sp. VK4C]|nr:tyrosine-type recombinase/integrase [Mesorhizobium sp. VK4C]